MKTYESLFSVDQEQVHVSTPRDADTQGHSIFKGKTYRDHNLYQG